MVENDDVGVKEDANLNGTPHKAPVTTNRKKSAADFIFGRIIGEGSYSTVFYTREKATGIEYAIKILNKNHIRKEKKEHIAMREKKILACLDHPFFVKLHFTFQDEYSLYYVLTLAKGGELLNYIKTLGKFNYMLTRFYSSEIFSAVNYLHTRDIIHRDLKPENILICNSLHIKITDFGTSKSLTESSSDNRTNSFVGTAQYASPELIKNSVAVKSSDIWAVGCVVYQMATGKLAFHDSNVYYIFQKISKIEYTIPDYIHDDIKDLIRKILIKEPEQRLGSPEMGGFSGIVDHSLFSDIIWEKIHLSIPPEQMSSVYNKIQSSIQHTNIDTFNLEDEKEINQENSSNNNVEKQPTKSEKKANNSLDLFQVRLKKHFLGNIVKSTKKSKTEEVEPTSCHADKEDHSAWEKFCFGNKILKKGILYKLRGIKPRKRMFIITEGPNIFYVDPKSMQLKGRVQWGKQLTTYVVDEVSWCINIPGRIFNLEDRSKNSASWVDFIARLHEKYFPDQNSS